MTATDQARKLLEAATAHPECDNSCKGDCELCEKWWKETEPAKREALAEIAQLGFTPATLAAAITLANFAQAKHNDLWYGQEHSCDDDGGPYLDSCKALAEWGRLFPEATGA